MDKAFREKLENFTVEPPSHIWEDINDQLYLKRKKIQMPWYSWAAVAAMLALALVAGWHYSRVSDNTITETAEIETDRLKERSNVVENIVKDDDIVPDQSNISQEKPVIQLAAATSEKTSFNLPEQQSGKDYIQTEEAVTSVREYDMQLMDNRKAEFQTDDNHLKLADKGVIKKESDYEHFERDLITENVILANRTVSDYEPAWKMGLNISPGYSSYSASHESNYASSMTYADNNGHGNISGGLSIQYKTGKKLSIETGVYYARNGQKSESFPQLYGVYGDSYSDIPATERLYFNPEVKVSDDRLSMNSIAGIIDFENVPQGAEITANLEKSDSYSSVLLTSGEFSQVFDFVEVPLYLRYLVVDSKIDVEVLGGINTGFIVGNNAYIKNEYGEQNIGKTRDISSVNFSGTVGLGVTYAISKNISLAMEPRLNYYLNSINNNPDVEFRPYRVGIYTGLYYAF
ncbi:MAG: hypothetical protein PHH93_08795 [Prolixibacteraceae bacterium]|nr:hypothetical protein [Prolixibacteraceae bacterium]